ncbi:unnamed protein product, partial [Laminaria digitata]
GGGSNGDGGDDDGDSRRTRGRTTERLVCVEEAILLLANANALAIRRLVVLDDVCDAEVVSGLQRAGFVVLVTTTNAGALSLERGIYKDRRVIKMEVPSGMTQRQAVTLLRRRQGVEGSKTELRDAAVDGAAGAPAGSQLLEVAENWCGLFPLALAVVDASGDAPSKMGWHRSEPWRHAEVQLGQQQQQQQEFDSSFNSVVGVSVTQLDRTSRDSFIRLGVLAEGAVVPKDMLSSLWEQSPRETDETIKKLADRSLLEEALPGSDSYHVHGPILSFAKAKLLRPDCPTATKETVVHLQASYLGRVDVLLRFSDGGGGAAWRGCSELGGIVALAALWESVESLRAGCSGCGSSG